MGKSLLYILLSFLILISCSRKNTGGISKGYHSMTTWNNTLYNGEVEMQKALESKKQSFREDYSEILKVEPIHYFPSEENPTRAMANGSNFRSGQKKASITNDNTPFGTPEAKALKAIEKHSMKIKGKEYNKMMVRAYNMLGKSHMFRGEYFEAIDAFNYINKFISKDKYKIVNNIYLAEAQEQLGNFYDAKTLYQEISDKKLKKSQKRLLAKKYSQLLINTQDDSLAFDILNWAYKYGKKKKDKGRYRFIQAQILEKLGDYEMAKDYYTKAYKKKPGFDMEVKSQMAISLLFDPEKDNFQQWENNLKKVSKKGTYKQQKNELYYAMANMALKVDSSEMAEKYFKESFKMPQSDPYVRTLAYRDYANMLYEKKDYLNASFYYDSAYSNATKTELREQLERRNSHLKELVNYYTTIVRNDSILRLVKMTPEERNIFFSDHIESLKQKEAEAAENQDDEASTNFILNNNENTNFSFSPSGKFYFYNENNKAKGQVEFKKIWGSRPLKDNWRTSSKFTVENVEENPEENSSTENDPRRFDLDFYSSQIPSDPKQIDNLKIERDSAEYKLGVLFHENLEDNPSAIKSLNNLLSIGPKNKDLVVAANYYLYKAAEREDPELAKKAKNFLLQNYPDSKFAKLILNPTAENFNQNSDESLALYERAYQSYQNGNYTETIEHTQQGEKQFSKDQIAAKFALLGALAKYRMGQSEDYLKELERISLIFAGTPEGDRAQELLNEQKK